MSSLPTITRWQKEVQRHFPKMSPAHGRVLGEVSYAMMLTNRCGTTHVSHWLAAYEGSSANTVRQRVREWYYEAGAKRGNKRREIVVEEQFADLLAWVLEGWEGEKRLALVLDATCLSDRLTSLSLGVVLQGCLIPVAWHLLPGQVPGEWKSHWLRLLALLQGVIPDDWHVVVMTDRGLYAGWLYQAICANGWHPLMRVNESMGFQAEGETAFRPIGERVKRRGRGWSGRGAWSEQGERMCGTLLVRWEQGYEEQLAVVTDQREEEVEASWYQMRFWTEAGFKDQKRGGWRWEQTKMTDPQRASRLWFALAVTLLWAVRVGSEEEGREQAEQERETRRPAGKRGRPRKQFHRPRAREQSVVVRGQQRVSVAVCQGCELPLGHVIAPAWPRHLYAVGKPTPSWVQKRQRRDQRRRESHHILSWKQRHQQHLLREQERETRRQARRELRQERDQEHERKRLARLARKAEAPARPPVQSQPAEPVCPSALPSPTPAMPPRGTDRLPPVLQRRGNQLVPFSPQTRAPVRQRPTRPTRALVTLWQGRLLSVVSPSVQENPP